jgi:hypothetical protein
LYIYIYIYIYIYKKMGRWVANEKKYKQTDLTTFTLPSFFQ